ncbi:MAG: hypothetical protein Q4C85_07885 [Actinomyces sp.]|uniref:hypothetical protein n=1 Tax=Actinomyces sp. TaxID=29317 RepID=UPI0026DD9512|nr:hypothetical protein [Actinomyces sp.]MDO4243663.1 hypothetical protein [Actinomyces sp.]
MSSPSPSPSAHSPSGEQAAAATDSGQWSSRRRQAAAERARMLQARQDAEHRRAARIVALFVEVARAEGLEPVPLRVRGYSGGTARTALTGWYLRTDRSVAIDVEGRFYVLVQALGLRERLLGAAPRSEPVPMTLGEGGRDGDVMPLRMALDRLLPGWEERAAEPLA